MATTPGRCTFTATHCPSTCALYTCRMCGIPSRVSDARLSLLQPPTASYSGAKAANRNAKVWHGATETGP
jgi:hypothetical protein